MNRRDELLRFIGVDHAALKAKTPAERRAIEKLLVELQEVRDEDPLQFFRPHARQHELMGTFAAIRAFLGGNRSGKTTVGVVDDLIQAIDAPRVPELLRPYKRWEPPFYCRIVTPDFTATMEGVVFQKLREWAPRAQLVGDAWNKAYDKQNRMLRFKNGSWFQFMTYEQDLDKFGGAALHRVHYDEEPPESIRKECLMRLIDYGGEELFTMTPLLGMSWMFTDIWEQWQLGKLEEGHVVTVDMDDNPYLDEKTKVRVLSQYSKEERKARKEGKFVHFGGLVYPEFHPERHVIPELPAPEGKQRPFPYQNIYLGIDPGQRHLAAVVFVAIEDDGTMIVFDEIALQGATVAQVAREIKMRCSMWKIVPRMTIIDPSAGNRYHQTGRSDQMEYSDHGINTVPGQNSVTAGINRIKERLETEPAGLVIAANCEHLIAEMRRYRWASPKQRGDDDPREAPIKKDDHLLDALRYVAMARPLQPKTPSNVVELSLYQRLVRDSLTPRRTQVAVAEGGPGRFR